MASVIASNVRKGNVIEKDGKLYVVLTAENIHPGKGTPVTQLEMRRISDGVKVNERYKPPTRWKSLHRRAHAQLPVSGWRAVRIHGPRNIDQIPVTPEVWAIWRPICRKAWKCSLPFTMACRFPSPCPPASARSHRDRAGYQGPDGLWLVQTGNSGKRRAHHGADTYRDRHTHCRADR